MAPQTVLSYCSQYAKRRKIAPPAPTLYHEDRNDDEHHPPPPPPPPQSTTSSTSPLSFSAAPPLASTPPYSSLLTFSTPLITSLKSALTPTWAQNGQDRTLIATHHAIAGTGTTPLSALTIASNIASATVSALRVGLANRLGLTNPLVSLVCAKCGHTHTVRTRGAS